MDTRIIGIGNPLRGDDGVGPAVVAALEEEALPEGVALIDGGEAGLGLVGLMGGAARVVLVDAANMGQAPGTVRVFGPEAALLEEAVCGAHSLRTASALKLAKALGCLPERVQVVGVQPRQMGWGVGLSREVSGAVRRAVKVVLEVVSGGV